MGPKHCLVLVDRLKNEWVVVCIDPPSRRNLMKGIQQETEQYNQFSKEKKVSPKGMTNSPDDEFIPPREKVVERPTPPWGRFNAPRENDTCRFRECSSRNIAFSPRGKFTPPKGRFYPPREKIADNFTSSRENAGERHVPPVIPIFPGGTWT